MIRLSHISHYRWNSNLDWVSRPDAVSCLLMIAVTVVGLGQQRFINILRRSTGLIKAIGAWMMMMAGIALTFYLTQPELIASWL